MDWASGNSVLLAGLQNFDRAFAGGSANAKCLDSGGREQVSPCCRRPGAVVWRGRRD